MKRVMVCTLAVLALNCVACGSDDSPSNLGGFEAGAQPGPVDSGPNDAGVVPALDAWIAPVDAGLDASLSADAASDGGAGSDAAGDGGDTAFSTCTAALKAKCKYDEKEVACSSLMTASIPLSDGGTWGNLEIPGGPYGAYVEWNEGMKFANPVNVLESTCDVLAGAFAEPASVTADVLNLRGQDLALYTVFRPACMKPGETYPVITWGNGTCGQSGGYAALLATVASHGFVVFAANSRFTDGGNKEMLKALDFAKASNEDTTSPLYQKLDLSKVGAMGHSQGASATFNAASDPRIKAIILWNGARSGQPAKPFLSVAGDRDTSTPTVATVSQQVSSATQPGAWLFYHKVLYTGGNVTGHLTLMEQAERVVAPAVAWWKYMLLGDAEAKKTFVGSDCALCNKAADFEYGQRNLP